MEFELKPCPFCGSKAEMLKDTSYILQDYVSCPECRLHTCNFRTPEEAAADWNSMADGVAKVGYALRKCPFCGYAAAGVFEANDKGEFRFYVKCGTCAAQGGLGTDDKHAAWLWNNRPHRKV